MLALWTWLDGKKTYITSIAMAVAALLLGLHKITQEQYNHFIIVALPAALAFLRQSINKPPTD